MLLRSALAKSLLAGLVLCSLGIPALAQDVQGKPGSIDPRTLGADPKEGRPQVEALLAKVKGVFENTNAISYKAYTNAYPKIPGKTGTGPDGRLIRKHVFDVQLSKAQTGAWRFAIALADDQVQKHDADDVARAGRVTFDTLTMRALRDDQKSVFERSVSTNGLGDIADFEAFLDQHGASMTILWDFLEDKQPLGNAARAAGAYIDKSDTVDGEPCTVLRVMDMPGVFVPDAFKDEVGTLYKISTRTSLPLMIQRVYAGKTPGTFECSRSLVLTDWKTNADATPGEYTLPVPDGYRVRAAQKMTIAGGAEKPTSPGSGTKQASGKTGPQKPSGAAAFAVAVGSQAPEFTLSTPDGASKSLSDYKGQLVLLDFWGTWCPPCRAAMPGMQNLHRKYKDKGLAVIGMNYERSKSADPVKFMKDNGYDYQILLNAEKVVEKYKITGFPTFFLLDRDGKILWSAVGHSPEHERELDKLIADRTK